MSLLEVKDLSVGVEEAEILHGISLDIDAGQTHVLMGPNGAGKSTLGYALMGNPNYRILSGEIKFDGRVINDDSADKRALAGMFLSFQNPLEVPGISLSSFVRNAVSQRNGGKVKYSEFKKDLASCMDVLSFDSAYKERDLNVGFSGGEKKKAEILQLLMLRPKLAILDETDSGLDVDAVRTVSKGIEEYKEKQNGALLIITHSTKILEALKVDYTHILVRGKIVASGDGSLVDEVNRNGFEAYLQ